MHNILLLFARFGTHITFLVLTGISFALIVNFNKTQNSIFLNSSNFYANKLDAKTSKWQQYLSLQEVNDSLAHHNANLMERFINLQSQAVDLVDSTRQYDLIPSNIIRSTYHLRNNHITLDRGSVDGVSKDMGVLSERGLIGIVRDVSDHFAHVVSILHSQTRISCTVEPHAYPGNLVWEDLDPNYMTLESIPKHVEIAVGDTVTTNGYSTIFPKGIVVGTVAAFKIDKGSSNYDIKVQLLNDVANTKVAYVIIDRLAEERLALENLEDE